jgi:hypothetical protein
MVADYITKPLQGMIFQQLWDMIMGNTNIALSLDTVSYTADQTTSGISAAPTHQESRSVLENENEIDRLPRSLPVSSAHSADVEKPHLTVLPAYGNTVKKPSNLVVSKPTVSWDEIASNRRRKE